VRPAAARGWRQVARNMHDPNGIIDARSASPTAPDLVAAISDEGLWSLEQKRMSLKECFSYECMDVCVYISAVLFPLHSACSSYIYMLVHVYIFVYCMDMSICMYVCMCMYLCITICSVFRMLCLYLYARIRVCIFVFMDVYVYMYLYVFLQYRLHCILKIIRYAYLHACMHACMYVCMHICICL